MITLDFETEAIVGNPLTHPPKPVGLAVKDGEATEYITDWERMKSFWCAALDGERDMLFHNAPFDLEVGIQHLGGSRPHWDRVHDTMYPIFLADPYSQTLSLKPSAERYLNEPPEEQNELHDWILANVPKATKKTAGAYICEAPIELVSPYAIGDVTRTRGLYDKLMPTTPLEPYNRERELSPILTEGTRRGIRIDRKRLGADIKIYELALHEVRDKLVKRLKCSDSVNFDSGAELADALDAAGLVDEWVLTPTGKRSTAKGNIHINDPKVAELLAYRSSLGTCMGTFMLPWYEMSREDGRVHPNWNSVRNTDRTGVGTRTGRLSSSTPNFQNVPNVFAQVIPAGLPPLPQMRSYCLPEPYGLWLKRDFSSQEIRILAHFENGTLMVAYIDDPDFDPHQNAMDLIEQLIGVLYPRKDVKITGFSIIYGAGVPGLSGQLGRPKHEAAQIKDAYLRVMPGIAQLSKMTQARGRAKLPIKTWGGRFYHVEPPKVIKGRMRDFSYKLLNYLIQGSAADQTKQCIIDWHNDYRGHHSVFLATVHDEINISAPKGRKNIEMGGLRAAMNKDYFDVPMRSDGFVGKNWQDLKEIA